MTRAAHLPDFLSPPVDEVAIGIQFAPVDGLTEPYFGLFWSKVRSKYPRVESKPRIEGPIESLNEIPSPAVQIQFVPPVGRTWYISSDDVSLIQIQDTRFVQNWRNRGGGYPHFDQVKDEFWQSFAQFRELLAEEQLPLPKVQQIELTYVNWIQGLGVTEFLGLASGATLNIQGVVPNAESQDWAARYLIEKNGSATARLYVQCQQMNRLTPPFSGAGIQMSLVYRAPFIEGMSDSLIDEHLEEGRRIIVQTFTALTTPTAHEIWGRTQ